MTLYEYSVWFLNNDCEPTDQDFEWVACFHIKASSKDEAIEWGNKISMDYVSRNPKNEILSSTAKLAEGNQLPIVTYGEMPTEQKIGW